MPVGQIPASTRMITSNLAQLLADGLVIVPSEVDPSDETGKMGTD